MAEKHNENGLLGAILRQVAKTGVVPDVPGIPALTIANELARFGAQRVLTRAAGPAAPPTRVASPRAPVHPLARAAPAGSGGKTLAQQTINWLDQSQEAKMLAGDLGRTAGLLPGAARGLWHTAEDVGHAAYLAQGFNPATAFMPTAQGARRRALSDAIAIGQKVSEAWDDPRGAVEDVKQGVKSWRAGIDPSATPQAETASGEFLRQFPIGLNQGELGFDVLSTLYGGAELKPLRLMRAARASTAAERAALQASKLGPWSPTAADYMARGIPEGLANYFAELYPMKNKGSHLWGRNRKLPEVLGGGKLPTAIVESPFNVLKPRGWTYGEMYERHHNVDGHFSGGKVPARHGGGSWSGKKLGWERYGPLRSFWYGAPGPLKAAVLTPPMLGAGAAVDYFDDGGE